MLPSRLQLAPVLLAGLVLAGLGGCTPAPPERHWASVRELTPATFAGRPVFDPGLATGSGGRVALTFVTRDEDGADAWVMVSADSGLHFTAPLRLNRRAGRVSSFPESRPVAAFGPGGRLVVAWAAARDSVAGADDVVARTSLDGGVSFGREMVLNDDQDRPQSRYHGFIALDFSNAGRVLATWIDGRNAVLAPGEGEPRVAQLWSVGSDDGGDFWRSNVLVADSVCPCCRPALRVAASGLVAIAYRGVRDTLRDPRLVFSHDGGETFAGDTLLWPDGWKLDACPVAGPSLTLARDGGHVAWYTGATGPRGRGPGVYVVPWRAGAGAAGPRRALAEPELDPAHPMLTTLGSLTLTGVMARLEDGRRVLALRTLAADGSVSPWLFLGANARSAALAGTDSRHAFATWLEQTDSGPRLRLALLSRT